MNQIVLILIGISVIVTAGFTVSLIIELKKTIRNANELLRTTESILKPTLEELQQTLSSLRNVSEDINEVTTDVKTLSNSVRDVGLNIRSVSNLIENVVSTTAITASGLRAGVKTGLEFLLKNLFSRIGGKK
jgi:uncharacterized protein YoxC